MQKQIKATIFEVDIDNVFENPANPRTIKAAAFKKLVKSIEEFPQMLWKRPPVCETVADGRYMALGGNKRSEAARKAGLKRIPIMLADDWTAEQKKRFVVLDNDQSGEWDFKMLSDQYDMSFILNSTSIQIPNAFANKSSQALDRIVEPPEIPVSMKNDIWILGAHRIMCGDSTSKEQVDKLLNGATPEMMVTDPPYGVEYDAEWRKAAGIGGQGTAVGKVANDDNADWREAWAHFRGDVAYVWHAGAYANTVADSLIACNFMIRAQIIWAKSQLVIGRGDYHYQHEPMWYCVRKGRPGGITETRTKSTLWRDIDDVLHPGELVFLARDRAKKVYGLRGNTSTIWEIPKIHKADSGHSTQKPVECMERPMRNHDCASVYDPFSGSGTTIIAAERIGRTCYAMELYASYVDVAVERWQAFAGREAVLQATGQPFAQVRAERLGK